MRHGYTLVELMVSSMVLSIVIVVAGSAMTLLLREGENNRNLMAGGSNGAASASAQAAAACQAIDSINSDLKVATLIVTTPTAGGGFQLALIVPARYAGDASETIVYQWNGPGSSLTRQLNANAASSIADNVQMLNISTMMKMVGIPPPTAGSEQLLIAHDGSGTGNVQSLALSQTNWASQYIAPSLPAGASSWSITHLKLQLQGSGATGSGPVGIQVYSADAAGHPLGLLASAGLDPASLPTTGQSWTDIPFTNLSTLSPGNGVCIVVSTSGSISPAWVFLDSAASDAGMSYCTSSDDGATWNSASASPTLQIQVYGTVTDLR